MNNLAYDILTNEYASFVVGQRAAFGQAVEKPVTWSEARRLAHLTFTVSKRQLIHPNGSGEKINSWGIFRDDNDVFLATVGKVYLPLQFEHAFTFVDALIGEADGAHYESAGALGHGNKFWVLAKVPAADFYVNGTIDHNKAYVLFTSSHDGSTATSCMLSHVRVATNTTLQTALRTVNGDLLRIKHTTNAERKLKAVKSLMDQIVLSSQDIAAKLNILAGREMTKDSMATVFDRVFGEKKGARHDNVLLRICDIFEKSESRSAYSLLSAITSYVDHEKGMRITKSKKGMTESMLRAEASVFGSGAELKEKAFHAILQETEPDPSNAPFVNIS